MEHAENSTLLPIKDFAKKIICDGHLYLRTKDGKRFYLMKPGVMIDASFVKKHASVGSTFDYISVVDQKVVDRFSKLFRELKYLQYEKDLREKSLEIVLAFQEAFTGGNTHFLSFSMACFNEFNGIGKENVLRMHETDLHLFRKALYSSAFSVMIALCNDFYHYPMIRDFYNLTLTLDIGLCDANYSYFVAEACNNENQNPGSGIEWMRTQNATQQEMEVFLKHPTRSHEFLKANPNLLAFKELAEVALYQHELSSGAGFPRGIPKGQVSSWEAVVILADSLVEIKDYYDFEWHVVDFLFGFRNKKLSELPIQRVYRKMCLGLGHLYKKQAVGT